MHRFKIRGLIALGSPRRQKRSLNKSPFRWSAHEKCPWLLLLNYRNVASQKNLVLLMREYRPVYGLSTGNPLMM